MSRSTEGQLGVGDVVMMIVRASLTILSPGVTALQGVADFADCGLNFGHEEFASDF